MFISSENQKHLLNSLSEVRKVAKQISNQKVPNMEILSRIRLGGRDCDITPNFTKLVINAIAKSHYSDKMERSSASFPIYNSNWVIGMFGSVFCDVKIGNAYYRINLITRFNCEGTGAGTPEDLGDTLFIYVTAV